MSAPSTYDVLVIGAGPAGSAAAWRLAKSGLRVALVDQHVFPRDKVCGDALIRDALDAINVMGLGADMASEACRVDALDLYAPNDTKVELKGEFLCLSRLRFDALLLDTAIAAGARFFDGTVAVAPTIKAGGVAGAHFKTGSKELTIAARQTLLATGANATLLRAFGLATERSRVAVAGRAYFRVPDDLAGRLPHLCVAYSRYLCPGYGWIFPGPDNCFNVGVGSFSGKLRVASLQKLWHIFTTGFAPAAEVLQRSQQITAFRGAPLRTGLTRADFGRPGLLAIGEAAATTYPCTGEGIGKAMESGLLAGEFVAKALAADRTPADTHRAYGAEFKQRFVNRYRAYRLGEDWTSRPWMMNLLARRANAGNFVRDQLEGLIAERDGVCRLFSVRGLITSLLH